MFAPLLLPISDSDGSTTTDASEDDEIAHGTANMNPSTAQLVECYEVLLERIDSECNQLGNVLELLEILIKVSGRLIESIGGLALC